MERMFHIRQRLRRRGGSQWYRDTSARKAATMCCEPVTDHDVDYKSKAERLTIEGTTWVPCTLCVKLRAAERARAGGAAR